MMAEDLHREAAERASSPQGMAALALCLLATPIPTSSAAVHSNPFYITIGQLANFFGAVQGEGHSVSHVGMNPTDLAMWEVVAVAQMDGPYLWGANFYINEHLLPNCVRLIDDRHRIYDFECKRTPWRVEEYFGFSLRSY